MDLFQLLLSQLGNTDVLGQIGRQIDISPDEHSKIRDAADLGLPAIIEALNRNTNTRDGADALAKALGNHSGLDLEHLNDILGKIDTEDGGKIMGHVFGDKNQTVTAAIAKKSGLNMQQAGKILAILGPIVLGYLARQKDRGNLDSDGVSNVTKDLSDALSKLGGGQAGGVNPMDMVKSVLDSNRDGNLIDDLGGLLGGLLKR